MIPLQAPPIPDAGTLDRLAGPHGGLVAMAIGLSLALGAIVWLVKRAFTREEAFATAKEKHAEQILAQQKDFAERLDAGRKEYAAKLEGYAERLIKGNMDDVSSQRDLAAQMRDLATSIRAAVKLP